MFSFRTRRYSYTFADIVSRMFEIAQTGNCIKTIETLVTQKSSEVSEQRCHVDTRNSEGLTPLMLSAKAGHLNVVKSFIKAGADIHATTTEGETSLILAASAGHLKVVKALIQAGANEFEAPGIMLNAIWCSYDYGHKDLIDYFVTDRITEILKLRKHSSQLSCARSFITETVLQDYPVAAICSAIYKLGPLFVDKHGKADKLVIDVLIWAITNDVTKVINSLASIGVNPYETESTNGETVLDIVRRAKNIVALKVLREKYPIPCLDSLNALVLAKLPHEARDVAALVEATL